MFRGNDDLPPERVEADSRKRGCRGELDSPHGQTWQQWQCACRGSWNDKPEARKAP